MINNKIIRFIFIFSPSPSTDGFKLKIKNVKFKMRIQRFPFSDYPQYIHLQFFSLLFHRINLTLKQFLVKPFTSIFSISKKVTGKNGERETIL
jgi:hypothetical protein